MHAGCRSENWWFLYAMHGLTSRGVRSSYKYYVTVYGSILKLFSTIFFQNRLLCQVHYMVLIYVTTWRHIIAKLP